MNDHIKTSMWRKSAQKVLIKPGCKPFPLQYIFPSGRQALSCSLERCGLTRKNRVALPEWGSHCVISAVGRYATPIPIKEVVRYDIDVDAILFYEQWGWPITEQEIEHLKERYINKIMIIDMVDSSHYLYAHKRDPVEFKNTISIMSLSKILGLAGGGIARFNNEYLKFVPDMHSNKIVSLFEKLHMSNEADNSNTLNIYKESIVALSSKLRDWINSNDLYVAVENERLMRQVNLKKLLTLSLTKSWPDWMIAAVDSGAGPGIVPLFRGASEDFLLKCRDKIMKRYGIETYVWHFNWSGSIIEPLYEKCLAFPIHGMIDLAEIGRKMEYML